MIRDWVKNLCTYIDNLDTSFVGNGQLPVVNNKTVSVDTYSGKHLTISESTKWSWSIHSEINLEEAEYVLLKDSIDNFKKRVNEARVLEFLKPFTK